MYHRVRIRFECIASHVTAMTHIVMHISPFRISYSFHILRTLLSRSIRTHQSFYLRGPWKNSVSIIRRGECYGKFLMKRARAVHSKKFNNTNQSNFVCKWFCCVNISRVTLSVEIVYCCYAVNQSVVERLQLKGLIRDDNLAASQSCALQNSRMNPDRS